MTHQRESAVVVGVDGSDKDGRTVDWAADEAASTGATLHILHCYPVLPVGLVVDPTVDAENRAAEVAERCAGRARSRHPELAVSTEAILEDPAVSLVQASRQARVVVVGARGVGRIAGRMLGSVSQKVAAHAAGPVVVVRDVVRVPRGPVVVGVDPLDSAPQLLDFAYTEAARRGVRLRLVHALGQYANDPWGREVRAALAEHQARALAQLVDDCAGRYPEVRVEVFERIGHPVDVLTAESATAGLLVVGSRGRTGLTGLRLGSVARGVLHEAPVVAVVRVAPAPETDHGPRPRARSSGPKN
ncbi:universal stress protein [Georgenia satyanarayanai]|uniref:universal stress protein n=1 Tax=Georgenia satyanarayanai TaxID=860221 RepID=UPI00186AEBB6|nr:universal stress protein [Georgenia satyanarayanai]